MRVILSKINFLLGKNPKLEFNKNWRVFIPYPYKSVVTITADFELAWAWIHSKVNNPYKLAIEKAKIERENIPLILELCEKFEIPITWATVGHLFLEKCYRNYENLAHPELPRIYNFENTFFQYNDNDDWFKYDPCSDYLKNPEWYAPDLIQMILNSKIKHEIGCHTFSHIDCRDNVCTPEVFEAELKECQKEAAKFGITLKSFVHPGHTIGNLDKLSKLGFTSFQTDPGNILGYPVKHSNGLWELKRTYELNWREGWSIGYHIYRYKKIIDRAIKNNAVCNFWFHPSFDVRFVLEILPEIFSYINNHRDKILITTVENYIDWLNEQL